jgi:hypothetical protein
MAIRRTLVVLLGLIAGACAGPASLMPGASGLEVQRLMGEPALRWTGADGLTYLAYPTGPLGFKTWLISIDAAGKVRQVENVLDETHFAAIKPGMTEEQVLHVLGPPEPSGTMYFGARDELAWEWRYCDDWHAASRFDVLFDASQRVVRSSLRTREQCRDDACFCAR